MKRVAGELVNKLRQLFVLAWKVHFLLALQIASLSETFEGTVPTTHTLLTPAYTNVSEFLKSAGVSYAKRARVLMT